MKERERFVWEIRSKEKEIEMRVKERVSWEREDIDHMRERDV